MLDVMLYGALPYVALALFLVVSIQRYRRDPFTFSSLSSQFLESKRLFWGSVPFHLGILTLFFGHLIGFLFPREVTLWNQMPVRLFILEATALCAGILTLVGVIGLAVRRATSPRVRQQTSPADIVVYLALLFQIITGLWVAIGLQWGSAWYTQTAVPYLWSLFKFAPDIQRVTDLPLAARLHVLGAFVLVALFPFTRLVHALVAPVPYLWRPVQLVIWYRERRRGDLRSTT
ncbi:MAG: respiratory nitrate reductase subunit gamma [Polyangiaceae bacterium]|nr:respiratory nitrate reductase subunit gamma [Polyangiaceae bacterium]